MFWWSIWSSLWVTLSRTYCGIGQKATLCGYCREVFVAARWSAVLSRTKFKLFEKAVHVSRTKISPVRSIFHLHLVWRLVKHAGSREANSVAWHCTRAALPNPQMPALSHRVVGNWLGTFGGQLIQISASELLKMGLTLWEDISNMRWAQKLLMWRLLLCNSTTNWKNNSSPRLRILENRSFTVGGIIISRMNFTSIFRGKFCEDFYNMQWAQSR